LITVNQDTGSTALTIVVQPNQSITRGGTWGFYLSAVLVAGTTSLIFAASGLWLVLPYTGIELLALGGALFYCRRQGQIREVISITRDNIAIEGGRGRPEWHRDFNRVWARVELEKPRIRGYPGRLTLRSHGKGIELGGFLTDEERGSLATTLVSAISRG